MAGDLYRALCRGLAIGAVALLAGGTAGLTPAHAQSDPSAGAWVEAHPDPVEPGGQVIVIGGCGDVNVDAVFESLAFAGARKVDGEIDHNTGQATAHVRIPRGLRPNTYNINLFCAGTEQASTTLTVTEGGSKGDHKSPPTKGPRTGGGGTAGDRGGPGAPLLTVAGGVAAAAGLALLLARWRRAT